MTTDNPEVDVVQQDEPEVVISFRQALAAGVNRLASALDDFDATVNRKVQASTAVDDARAQVASAQSQLQVVTTSEDETRKVTLLAFDDLSDTLAAGRATLS